MKTLSKSIVNLTVIGLLVIGSVGIANAQRGISRSGFHRSYGGRPSFGRPIYNSHIRVVPRVYFNAGLRYNRAMWLGSLPYGNYPFFYGVNPYYYFGGVFYEPSTRNGYQVASAPIGAEVPSLPNDANPLVINGQSYLEYGGVYYIQLNKTDGIITYMVVGRDGTLDTKALDITQHLVAVVGDVTANLPQTAKKVKIDGKKYWVTPSGIYLEKIKIGSQNGYRVAKV